MKRKILGIGVIIGAAVFFLAACGRPCGPPRFPGCFVEKKVRHIERELKMTDAQKAQFREIRGRMKADIVADFGEKRKLMETVNERLKADNPNIDEIVTLARAQMRKSHARMEEKLSYISEFYNILNPEQKKILLQRVREHMADKEKRGDKFLERLNEIE